MDVVASSSFSAILASLVQGKSASQENKKSIESLPTQRWEQLLKKINKNKKVNDIKLSELIDLDYLICPDSEKVSYNLDKIYNIFIANKNLPPALLYSMLNFFVREKGLDLKAALSLPADVAESKELQIIQGAGSMAPFSKKESVKKSLKNIETSALKYNQLDEALPECFKNLRGSHGVSLPNKLSSGHIACSFIQNSPNIIIKNMVASETENMQSDALDLLERELSNITGSQLGEILYKLEYSSCFLKSPELRLRASDLCITNLKRPFEKKNVLTHLTPQQLSEIIIIFTRNLIDKQLSKEEVPLEVKVHTLNFFESGISYLQNEGLSKVLNLWSNALLKYLNKKNELVPIFCLVEENIDQLPIPQREFTLQWAAENLPNAFQPNVSSILAFIEQKVSSISGIPKSNTLGLLAKNLPNLDEKMQRQAIELLQKHMTNGQDFGFLQRAVDAFYKFAANFYPLNFDKVLAFFLAPFKMVWAFFANMSKLV